MSDELHTPKDLLAGQSRAKFTLLGKYQRPSVVDIYYEAYHRPDRDGFCEAHPMARVNHMLGELKATFYLLQGIAFLEPDATRAAAMTKQSLAINAEFKKLSDSLLDEMSDDNRTRTALVNPRQKSVAWAEGLENLSVHLIKLETNIRTAKLDNNPDNNAALHAFLKDTIHARIFSLIEAMEAEATQWKIEVAPKPTHVVRVKGRPRMSPEELIAATDAAVLSGKVRVVTFGKKPDGNEPPAR